MHIYCFCLHIIYVYYIDIIISASKKPKPWSKKMSYLLAGLGPTSSRITESYCCELQVTSTLDHSATILFISTFFGWGGLQLGLYYLSPPKVHGFRVIGTCWFLVIETTFMHLFYGQVVVRWTIERQPKRLKWNMLQDAQCTLKITRTTSTPQTWYFLAITQIG